MSDKFTKLQPKDGETVLHCGHLEDKPHHFFALSDGKTVAGINFKRPDGSQGLAHWMVLCEMCFTRNGDEPERCIRGDATWIGDEPEIREPSLQ